MSNEVFCCFCSSKYPEAQPFCNTCGIPWYKLRCPQCGTEILNIRHKFCGKCGSTWQCGWSDIVTHLLKHYSRDKSKVMNQNDQSFVGYLSIYTSEACPPDIAKTWLKKAEEKKKQVREEKMIGMMEFSNLGNRQDEQSAILFLSGGVYYVYEIPRNRRYFRSWQQNIFRKGVLRQWMGALSRLQSTYTLLWRSYY